MAEAVVRYAIKHNGTFDDKQTFVLDEIGFGEEGSFTITNKGGTITSIGRIKAKVSSGVEVKIVYNTKTYVIHFSQ